jgi:hypothetical protein
MDDRGIPFTFRTSNAVGEVALLVARQSNYFDLFAALLNTGITPPPSGTSPYTSMGMKTLTRFLHPGDKKESCSAGGQLGPPALEKDKK